MLKVLLVDDEEIICQMIEKLIDWKGRGLEVIGVANSGAEAFAMMQDESPDIIISDVHMPGMDGLQLVKKGQELNRHIDYILMSGYKQFEYPYKALKLGVVYYLLKPINKAELEEALDRIIKSRTGKKTDELIQQEMEQAAKAGNKKIRKHFLNDIIHVNGISTEKEKNQNIASEIEFVNEYFLSFLTKVDQNISDSNIDNLLNAIDYPIEKIMDQGEWEYINSYVKRGVVTIVNFKEENRSNVMAAIKEVMASCRQEIEKFQGCYVTIGIGGEKHTLSQVQSSVKEAVEAVQCRIKLGTDRIISYQELGYQRIEIHKLINAEEVFAFNRVINSLDCSAFLNRLENIIKVIRKTDHYSPVSIFEAMNRIKEICFKQFRENYIPTEILDELDEKIQFIYDSNFKEDILVYGYKEAMRELFQDVIEERGKQQQRPIRAAEQYIQEHYSEPITLEEIADVIQLSPTYLSTIFKKEKGIKFSEYLTAYRMEQAKIMLKDTTQSINIVAEKSGYTDPNYFSKAFNKFVGLKPSEYRKLYS